MFQRSGRRPAASLTLLGLLLLSSMALMVGPYSPPTASAATSTVTLVVMQDGSGDHTTIQAALDAIPADLVAIDTAYVVEIGDSELYTERVRITGKTVNETAFITLQAGTGAEPRLQTNANARWALEIYERYTVVDGLDIIGGNNRYGLYLQADDARLTNLTLGNITNTGNPALLIDDGSDRTFVQHVTINDTVDALEVDNADFNVFRDIAIWNASGRGLHVYDDSRQNLFSHLTIHNASVGIQYGSGTSGQDAYVRNHLFNTIVSTPNGTAFKSDTFANTSRVAWASVFDHNLWWAPNGTLFDLDDTQYNDLASWQADTRRDPSSLHADPLFRDAENGDLRLESVANGDAADSPALDAGLDSSVTGTVTTDLADVSRPQGTYVDIGAHEAARTSAGVSTPASFRVEIDQDPIVAGSAGSLTVTALNDLDEVITGFTGTVDLTSSDSGLTLAPSITFVGADNGVKSTYIEFATVGEQWVRAELDGDATVNGTRSRITVDTLAAQKLIVKQDGTGDHATIGAAIAALAGGLSMKTIVEVQDAGWYWERVLINSFVVNATANFTLRSAPGMTPRVEADGNNRWAIQVQERYTTVDGFEIIGGNRRLGIYVGTDDSTISNMTISGIWNTAYPGILVDDGADRNLIERITIHDVVDGIELDEADWNHVRDVAMWNMSGIGLHLYDDTEWNSFNHISIHNASAAVQIGLGTPGERTSGGNRIHNTVGSAPDGIAFHVAEDRPDNRLPTGTYLDHNAWWAPNGTAIRMSGTNHTLSDWQNLTGTSLNSMVADPLFRDADAGDLRLKSQVNGDGVDSPLLEQGLATDATGQDTFDLDMVTRPQGPLYDIGAYEGEATSAAPNTPVRFEVTVSLDPILVGQMGLVQIVAYNDIGGLASAFAGVVNLTTTDGGATLSATATFTALDLGVHVTTVTFANVGEHSITATLVGDPTVNGHRPRITVTDVTTDKVIVRQDGRGDFTTIQAAINSLSDPVDHPTIIEIADRATYWEDVNVDGAVTNATHWMQIRGVEGAEATVTSDYNRRPSFRVRENHVTIEHLTLWNDGNQYGIYTDRDDQTYRNLTVIGGSGYGYGGIYLGWGTDRALVENNTIIEAQVGIRLREADTNVIRNNIVVDSDIAGIQFDYHSTANTIVNNAFLNSTTAEVWFGPSYSRARDDPGEINRFHNNIFQASLNGSIFLSQMYVGYERLPFATRSDFNAFSVQNGPFAVLDGKNLIDLDAFTAWTGRDVNSLETDPLFNDTANGSYWLESLANGDGADSPLIDAGAPLALLGTMTAAYGGDDRQLGWRTDIGPYETARTSTAPSTLAHVTHSAPSAVQSGVALPITLEFRNDAGDLITDWEGNLTVELTTGLALWPSLVAVTSADNGTKQVNITFATTGEQEIWVNVTNSSQSVHVRRSVFATATNTSIVRQDGAGDFTTIQAAEDALPSSPTTPHVIEVHDSLEYRERVYVSGMGTSQTNNLTIRSWSDELPIVMSNRGSEAAFSIHSRWVTLEGFELISYEARYGVYARGDNMVVRNTTHWTWTPGWTGYGAIRIVGSHDSIISHNRIDGTWRGIDARGWDNYNTEVSNNIVTNTDNACALVWRNARNMLWAHNVLYGCPVVFEFGTGASGRDMGYGNRFISNVGVPSSGGTIIDLDSFADVGVPLATTMDHNDWYTADGTFALYEGAPIANLAAWQSISGQRDVNSISADPLFIDAAGGNFDVWSIENGYAVDSPLLGHGGLAAVVDDINTDFAWAVRPQGARHDIGAYEHARTSLAPNVPVRFEMSVSHDPLLAGNATTVTVTAINDIDEVASGFVGTVLITTLDPNATHPASVSFTGPDNGSIGVNVTLVTLGEQWIQATQQGAPSVYGRYDSVTVVDVPTAKIVVRKDGSGNYTRIQDAVNSLTNPLLLPTIIEVGDSMFYHEDVAVTGTQATSTEWLWIRGKQGQTPTVSSDRDNRAAFRVHEDWVTISDFILEGGYRRYGILTYEDDGTYRNLTISGGFDRSYPGIYLYGADRNHLEANTIHDMEQGIRLYASDWNTIVNNVVYDNTYVGIHLRRGSHHNNLSNNVLVDNRWELWMGTGGTSEDAGPSNLFVNNVLVVDSAGIGIRIDNWNDTRITPPLTVFDHNLYDVTSGGQLGYMDTGGVSTIPGWQVLASDGDNDSIAAPALLASINNAQFWPKYGSPAIDGGQNRSDVPTDFFGNSRPEAGGWDIGPFEYGPGKTDTDGDGVSDLFDFLPLDRTQWVDTDEDGYGDNTSGTLGDVCPLTWGNVTDPSLRGCPMEGPPIIRVFNATTTVDVLNGSLLSSWSWTVVEDDPTPANLTFNLSKMKYDPDTPLSELQWAVGPSLGCTYDRYFDVSITGDLLSLQLYPNGTTDGPPNEIDWLDDGGIHQLQPSSGAFCHLTLYLNDSAPFPATGSTSTLLRIRVVNEIEPRPDWYLDSTTGIDLGGVDQLFVGHDLPVRVTVGRQGHTDPPPVNSHLLVRFYTDDLAGPHDQILITDPPAFGETVDVFGTVVFGSDTDEIRVQLEVLPYDGSYATPGERNPWLEDSDWSNNNLSSDDLDLTLPEQVGISVKATPGFVPSLVLVALAGLFLSLLSQRRREPEAAPVRLDEDDEAVSPVVATILLVAVTLVLAAIVYLWAADLANVDTKAGVIEIAWGSDAVIDDTVDHWRMRVSQADRELSTDRIQVSVEWTNSSGQQFVSAMLTDPGVYGRAPSTLSESIITFNENLNCEGGQECISTLSVGDRVYVRMTDENGEAIDDAVIVLTYTLGNGQEIGRFQASSSPATIG